MAEQSAKNNLKDIFNAISWTATGVTLLTTGVQAAALKLLHIDEAIQLLDLFFQTAPLTLAVAILIQYTVHHTKMYQAASDPSLFWNITGWLVVVAVVLFDATFIGNRLGGLPRVEPANLITMPSVQESVRAKQLAVIWHAGAYAVNAVAGYYQVYGWAKFGSSLLLGIFLAWLWWKLGLTSPNSPAQPLVVFVLVIVSIVGILAETKPTFEKHLDKLNPNTAGRISIQAPSQMQKLERPLSKLFPGFEVALEPAPPPFVYHDHFVCSTTTSRTDGSTTSIGALTFVFDLRPSPAEGK